MDTHFAPSPALDQEADPLHARLPGELDSAPSGHEPAFEREPLAAGDKLPSSGTRRRSTGRKKLLLGAVAATVLVVGGGAYLASPYNHLYPMPRLASTVRSTAAEVGVKLPPLLAPSASLAKVNVPPSLPAMRDTYAPKSRDQEVAELLSLHAEANPKPAPIAPIAPGARALGGSHSDKTVASGSLTSGVGGIDVPRGYVASEPGSTLPVASLPPREPVRLAAAVPVPSIQTDLTASAKPVEPPAVQPPPSLVEAVSNPPATSQTSAPAPVSMPTAPIAPPVVADPVAVAQTLRPAPMSSSDQVQVLGLVTEMASMVKDLRKQNAQLRSDFGKSSADTSAHLRDYERRLALAEAKSAMSAASDVGSEQAVAQSVAEPAPVVKPTPISLTRAIAVVPAAAAASAAKLYRVQAASPGLALLAQVDRGGGEGAQIQVAVGDNIPDYGRVKSIGQKGTAWVVTTEHGPIQ